MTQAPSRGGRRGKSRLKVILAMEKGCIVVTSVMRKSARGSKRMRTKTVFGILACVFTEIVIVASVTTKNNIISVDDDAYLQLIGDGELYSTWHEQLAKQYTRVVREGKRCVMHWGGFIQTIHLIDATS